jgi:integrase
MRPHDLRHTYAALMLAAGTSLEQISANMGHASIRATYDLYGHLVPGSGREGTQRLGDLMSRDDVGKVLASGDHFMPKNGRA